MAGYSESRAYTKRAQPEEGSVQTARRTAWRKASGAEVGQVMLRRIEGSMPMAAVARRCGGGRGDRTAGDGSGNEGIT